MRFDISTRVLHWSHTITFIWLMTTGIWLFITLKSLLNDPLIKMVHIYASLPFILFPLIIYIVGSACTRNDVKELMEWGTEELRWFIELLKKDKTRVAGKFNAGQKTNFLATLLLIIGLSFSGFVVWMKSMFSRSFVELNFIVHDFFAIIALLLLSGHIIFTMYYSKSLRGIVFGEVDAGWAEEHYPNWFWKMRRE